MSKDIMDMNLPEYDLILVDGMNLAYRSFYGLQQLQWNGKPTGMLYGVARLMFSMLKLYPKAKLIFLWEGTQSRRKAIFEGYKKSRKRGEYPFYECVKEVNHFLTIAGVDQAYHLGLEADDMAGYIVSTEKDKRILLVTADEDWYQFLERGRVDIQRRNIIETYDDVGVLLEFPPERMGLYKILRGGHDDLPGIKGIQRPVVQYIVNNCSDYRQIIDCPIGSVRPSWARWEKAIQENWDIIEQNAKLVLFHPEWIHKDQIAYTHGQRDNAALFKLFDENGIRAFNKELK